MRDALTIVVVHISRQQGQSLLHVSQDLRLKAGADFWIFGARGHELQAGAQPWRSAMDALAPRQIALVPLDAGETLELMRSLELVDVDEFERPHQFQRFTRVQGYQCDLSRRQGIHRAPPWLRARLQLVPAGTEDPEIRACLEAEILTDVQQRLALLSRDMDNHNGQRIPHQLCTLSGKLIAHIEGFSNDCAPETGRAM